MDVAGALKVFAAVLAVLIGIPSVVVIAKVAFSWGGLVKTVQAIAGEITDLKVELGEFRTDNNVLRERVAIAENDVRRIDVEITSLREAKHKHGNEIQANSGRILLLQQQIEQLFTALRELKEAST